MFSTVFKSVLEYFRAKLNEFLAARALSFLRMFAPEIHSKAIKEEVEEELDPDVAAYRDYVNAQIFETYEDNDLEIDVDEIVFHRESVNIDDPRISEEQREAIREAIREYGIEGDVNFDIPDNGEEFYNFNPAAGDRIIFAVTPWGEVISSLFSQENMDMAHEVSKIENKEIDDVILEVMAERYNIANDME